MRLIVTGDGVLRMGDESYQCALGEGGLARVKKEGDLATPVGRFPLRSVYFRADRLAAAPKTSLPMQPILRDDGWCIGPNESRYNQHVKLPYIGRAERLWRDDGLYDLLVVIGYNDSPPEPLRGSAIFLHVATPDLRPTEGCVALRLTDLRLVVARLGPGAEIEIRASDG